MASLSRRKQALNQEYKTRKKNKILKQASKQAARVRARTREARACLWITLADTQKYALFLRLTQIYDIIKKTKGLTNNE